jgi:iron(III) transport system substrate-binding protein
MHRSITAGAHKDNLSNKQYQLLEERIMTHRQTKTALLVAGIALGGLVASTAQAQELPKSTQKYLDEANLSRSAMAGLEEELAVPKAWLEGAKKEGTVKILGSWKHSIFEALNAPFQERYPSIKVEYSESGNFNNRVIGTLVAFRQGHYTGDVVTSLGGAVPDYNEVDALADLRELPAFGKQVEGASDPEGKWAAMRLRYWCMGYNTNLVKQADLPKTWDDLITNSAWHNGNIGAGNRPQLWVSMLYNAWGPERTAAYVKEFFQTVKPQFRKEGMTALLGLASAGEFHAALPSAPDKVLIQQEKGAPLGWHCPEPVPLAASHIGVLKGSPNVNAARIWMNWFLSKEGQLAQFVGTNAQPSHKDLQREELVVFADEVAGKKTASRHEEDEPKVYAIWEDYWNKSGK